MDLTDLGSDPALLVVTHAGLTPRTNAFTLSDSELCLFVRAYVKASRAWFF